MAKGSGEHSGRTSRGAVKRGLGMAPGILVKNAWLIDSISDQPRNGVSIIVDNERITAVV
jgi:hypothetical protein